MEERISQFSMIHDTNFIIYIVYKNSSSTVAYQSWIKLLFYRQAGCWNSVFGEGHESSSPAGSAHNPITRAGRVMTIYAIDVAAGGSHYPLESLVFHFFCMTNESKGLEVTWVCDSCLEIRL